METGKLLIELGSSFRISLRLYLILLLQKFIKIKTTKLSLESWCSAASNFSSDCYSDQSVCRLCSTWCVFGRRIVVRFS